MFGPTKASTKDNSKTITSKVSAIIDGPMEDNTKDNGKIIKCMESDILYGLMEDSIKVLMLMIKNKDRANSYGLMEEVTRDTGKMENKMVEVCIGTSKVFKSMELGQMEEKLSGITDVNDI